jgi:pimeloyl-ACP methyl ester carboxylesterase
MMRRIWRTVRAWPAAVLLAASADASAPQRVEFRTQDGARLIGDLYESAGAQGVILAHGGRFTRQSWKVQAERLSRAGHRVLAFDFRGFGESTGPGHDDPLSAPLHLDILAAVRFLRSQGARQIAVVGGSLGGMAAGDAAVHSPDAIDRIVFLGAPASLSDLDVTGMKGRKLFIVAREDRNGAGMLRLERIRSDYERVPPPRELLVVNGGAHAQALFDTDESSRVMHAILSFLDAP